MSRRSKQLEEEALKEGLTPTKDLQIDESELSEEEKGHYSIPWTSIIIVGVLFLIVVGLTITILILNR